MEFYNILNEDYFKAVESDVILPVFKVEILDNFDRTLAEITNKIGSENSGSISISYNQGVRSTCSLTLNMDFDVFDPNNADNLWIGRKFKVYIGIVDKQYTYNNNPLYYDKPNNESVEVNKFETKNVLFYNDIGIATSDIMFNENINIYWFSKGVYYVNNPTIEHNQSNKTITINGVDKFGMLDGTLGSSQLLNIYSIPSGTIASKAISDILLLTNSNNDILDIVEPKIDKRVINEKLPYTITKSPSETLGDLLIEIANVLGCNIYYDYDGCLNIESGTLDISYSQESSIYSFSEKKNTYISSTVNLAYDKVVNIVKVVGNNINGMLYKHTEKNNNFLSPVRTSLIGDRMKYIENPNIYNYERAIDFAKYTLNRESMLVSSISIESSFIPHLEEDKVIEITDSAFRYDRERFIITGLSIPLSTSEAMTVTATNTASLPYYELQSVSS